MRHFPAHRRFSFAAIVLAGILPGMQSVPGAEATEEANDIEPIRLSVRSDKGGDFDLAKLNARARVVYVSSGVIARELRMIDNSLGTSFHFSGLDLRPTVVVKLGQSQPIHRVSVAYQTRAARLDVYLLNELPKRPGDFSGKTPIASIVDLVDNGETTVDFAPTTARFVAFQWIRDQASTGTFEVAEVSAFTDDSHGQIPPRLADAGNAQGAPVEPPIIPIVSPD
jgi:hypothetical protein